MTSTSNVTIINMRNNYPSCNFMSNYCGFSMSSCFGFGFGGYSMPFGCNNMLYGGCGSFKQGFGAGLGMVAGSALISALPKIVSCIGKGCSSLWNKIFHNKASEKA